MVEKSHLVDEFSSNVPFSCEKADKSPSIEWKAESNNKNHLKARAMKKETFWSIMTEETGWSNMTIKQKLLATWFSLSFCCVLIFAESLTLTAVSLVSLAISAHYLKKSDPLKEE